MAEETGKELWQELHDAIGNVFRERIKAQGKDDFAFQSVAAYEELHHLTCEYVNSAVSRFEEFVPKLPDKKPDVKMASGERRLWRLEHRR